LQKENFNTVDYDLVEVNKTKVDGRIFLSGFKWANPREDSFKKEVRSVYEDYNSAVNKAKKMKKHILFNYNSTAIKKKYDKIFQRVV